MAFTPSNPFTGATMVGFTTPTYSYVTDTAPSVFGKQLAINTAGGTQVGVTVNTVSSPFTMTFFRPAVLKPLPQANPVTGVIKNVPMNQYKLITRKGVVPALNQAPMVCRITTIIEVPAGADTYDVPNVKAALCAHIGALANQSADIWYTTSTGVV